MPAPVRRDETNMRAVGATLLFLNHELSLFHYNKLIYLFEYFYIKNFGKRFTKEVFVKLTHGPVITEYKKHIESLIRADIASGDIRVLREKRIVDDTLYPKFRIASSKNTKDNILTSDTLLSFAKSLSERFATLSVADLEQVAYSTQPMRAFMISPWKREGSYILHAECLKMADHSNVTTEGRRRALEHLRKYPEIDYDQQQKLAKEFSGLSRLRPAN